MFKRIDHIGVAVEDLDSAIKLYERSFEMELVHRETVESQGVEAVLLDVGEGHIELLAPRPGVDLGRHQLIKVLGAAQLGSLLFQLQGPYAFAQRIQAAHLADEGRPIESVWDAVTGATAYARDIPWTSDRVDLEEKAGALLDLVG